MSTAHTPGPWRCDRRDILAADGQCIAKVFSGPCATLEEADANARLVAAAPELLRCAVMALEELEEAARVNPLAVVASRFLRDAIEAATLPPCPPPGADRTPPTADRPAPTGHASSASHRRRSPAHVCTSCAGGLFTTCRPRMRPGSACACTTRPERGPHQPGRRGFQPGRAWRGAQTLNPAARTPGTACSPRMRPTDRPMVTAPRGAPARTQRTAG